MSAPSAAALRQACAALGERDPALARAYEEVGTPEWRSAPATYETIARLIAHQQISTTAARAIWARAVAAFDPFTAEAILEADPETVRACGLSRPKVGHLRSIAEAIVSGALRLDEVAAAGDLDASRKALVSVKGIGPWTAEIFLLYAGGALDAFPTADLGLMESYRQLSGAAERPDAKAFAALGEAWRPYRGVAAHLLWGWIAAERETRAGASPQA